MQPLCRVSTRERVVTLAKRSPPIQGRRRGRLGNRTRPCSTRKIRAIPREKKTRSMVKVDLFLQVSICSDNFRTEIVEAEGQRTLLAVPRDRWPDAAVREHATCPCRCGRPALPASVHGSCDPHIRQIKRDQENGGDRLFWSETNNGTPGIVGILPPAVCSRTPAGGHSPATMSSQADGRTGCGSPTLGEQGSRTCCTVPT